jgi:hypothetical protein
MRAPIGDGAAALVCSKEYLAALPSRVRERAVKIRASTMSGGKYRSLDEPGLSLAENGGGVIGFDEAACAITILEKVESI